MVARMALIVIQILFLLLLMAPQFKGLNHCLCEGKNVACVYVEIARSIAYKKYVVGYTSSATS